MKIYHFCCCFETTIGKLWVFACHLCHVTDCYLKTATKLIYFPDPGTRSRFGRGPRRGRGRDRGRGRGRGWKSNREFAENFFKIWFFFKVAFHQNYEACRRKASKYVILEFWFFLKCDNENFSISYRYGPYFVIMYFRGMSFSNRQQKICLTHIRHIFHPLK